MLLTFLFQCNEKYDWKHMLQIILPDMVNVFITGCLKSCAVLLPNLYIRFKGTG